MPLNRLHKYQLGRYLPSLLTLVDWIMFNILFAVVLYIFPEILSNTKHINYVWIVQNLCIVPVMMRLARTKEVTRTILLDKVMLRSLSIVGLHALFFLSLSTLLDIQCIPTRAYLTYYGMLMVVLPSWSIFSARLIKMYRRHGYNYLRVAIIGNNITAKRLREQMEADPGFGYKILAFFDHDPTEEIDGLPGKRLDTIDQYVKSAKIDQLYFTMAGHNELLSRAVKVADDNVIDFFYVPQISKYVSRGFAKNTIGAVPVLSIRSNPLSKAVNRLLKRSFDLLFAGLFMLIYPLIYTIIAIGIKITSPGPVYFRQQRTGYKGKPFTCLKFRTMHVNREADTAQATANDPRKTRFGNFLRRTSLDELPQFINVLRGEMSVVGPRPHMLKHTEEYSKLVDRYMVRHFVKPGITGWAQVNGYRGLTDELWKMEKRVQHDVWYIENWTFALDLRIIARTILNVFHGESNAF